MEPVEVRTPEEWLDAAACNDVEAVRRALSAFRGSRGPHGETALMLAGERGFVELATLLAPYEVQLMDDAGLTALARAAAADQVHVIPVLLDEKNVLTPNRQDALMLAAHHGALRALHPLLSALPIRTDRNGHSALFYAAEARQEACVRLLLESTRFSQGHIQDALGCPTLQTITLLLSDHIRAKSVTILPPTTFPMESLRGSSRTQVSASSPIPERRSSSVVHRKDGNESFQAYPEVETEGEVDLQEPSQASDSPPTIDFSDGRDALLAYSGLPKRFAPRRCRSGRQRGGPTPQFLQDVREQLSELYEDNTSLTLQIQTKDELLDELRLLKEAEANRHEIELEAMEAANRSLLATLESSQAEVLRLREQLDAATDRTRSGTVSSTLEQTELELLRRENAELRARLALREGHAAIPTMVLADRLPQGGDETAPFQQDTLEHNHQNPNPTTRSPTARPARHFMLSTQETPPTLQYADHRLNSPSADLEDLVERASRLKRSIDSVSAVADSLGSRMTRHAGASAGREPTI
ncbi:Ankyrin repeat protein 1 [Giardia muris]|uniref:Ankyrin repeat protein 1 n=1 Tax=Giardia muris TaxID=5742 RepID=A0A4Z1STF2_GIAMU|nr:Ankyrin repeat protein 1 [Giardia muris]|eukprot:TNJ29030.1 Ankyrin repeat protein 1 [Giardia muris]